MKDRPKRLPDKIKPGTNGDVGYRGCMRLPVEESERHAEDHQTLNRKANYVYDVKDYGARGDGVGDDTAAFADAASAASAAGGGIVSIPPGEYMVNTIKPPDGSVAYQGYGSNYTHIRHLTDAGPILDMSLWTYTQGFEAHLSMGGFTLWGRGTDISEYGVWMDRADGGAYTTLRVSDMAVRGTGGPCLFADRLYLSVLRDCVFTRPDGIDRGHDVPYVELMASNGTRLSNCGFRSRTTNVDAPSGMLRLSNSDRYRGHDLVIRDCWTEYPHPSDVLVYCENDAVTFTDWSWFDMSVADTDTSWVHLAGNGNTWRSAIPGTYGNNTPNPYAGIKVSGNRNRIDGIKGYTGGGGANVVLEPGAEYNVVIAAGQDSGVPGNSAPMVDDRSGNSTNVLLDLTNGQSLLTILGGV